MTLDNSIITFSDSTFSSVFGLSKGSVIRQSQGSSLLVRNSLFENNASPFGGIASVAYSDARLVIEGC